jgi:hypothetical protein
MIDDFLVGILAHEMETGGGPTGFGIGSFFTLLFGLGAIVYMTGRYFRARNGLGTESTEDSSTDRALRDPGRT